MRPYVNGHFSIPLYVKNNVIRKHRSIMRYAYRLIYLLTGQLVN